LLVYSTDSSKKSNVKLIRTLKKNYILAARKCQSRKKFRALTGRCCKVPEEGGKGERRPQREMSHERGKCHTKVKKTRILIGKKKNCEQKKRCRRWKTHLCNLPGGGEGESRP